MIESEKNLVQMNGDAYAWSLRVWGDAIGEIWDPHKKDYIEAVDLPKPLFKAYKNLWEVSGDDYLVEFRGNYYYMMDHIYNENVARSFGIERWNDLYDVALENATKAANHEALRDTIVLVAKKSVSLGAMHVVSVLVNAEESKENVEKIRQVLSDCMFKKPERVSAIPLDLQIKSASTRAEASQSSSYEKIKEYEPEF